MFLRKLFISNNILVVPNFFTEKEISIMGNWVTNVNPYHTREEKLLVKKITYKVNKLINPVCNDWYLTRERYNIQSYISLLPGDKKSFIIHKDIINDSDLITLNFKKLKRR